MNVKFWAAAGRCVHLNGGVPFSNICSGDFGKKSLLAMNQPWTPSPPFP